MDAGRQGDWIFIPMISPRVELCFTGSRVLIGSSGGLPKLCELKWQEALILNLVF